MLMIIILAASIAFPAYGNPSRPLFPLNLPWSQTVPNTFREIPAWNYYYGDSAYGLMVFYGKAFDMESELQIRFAEKKISSATLILGPSGLSDYGCMTSYKEVIRLLTVKYGKSSQTKIIESEIKEDLIYSTICSPIRSSLFIHETVWNLKDFFIVAAIFGDDVDIFIEIEYIYKPLKGKKKKIDEAKLLKLL